MLEKDLELPRHVGSAHAQLVVGIAIEERAQLGAFRRRLGREEEVQEQRCHLAVHDERAVCTMIRNLPCAVENVPAAETCVKCASERWNDAWTVVPGELWNLSTASAILTTVSAAFSNRASSSCR